MLGFLSQPMQLLRNLIEMYCNCINILLKLIRHFLLKTDHFLQEVLAEFREGVA